MEDHNNVVLVVDDEEQARDCLRQILELEGFDVRMSGNGAEALDYLNRSEQPRVIILDIRMPVMNGPQFRAAMLKDPRLSAIPVIIVTALDSAAAADLFAVKVFRKPLDVRALVSTVHQHCRI